MWDFERRRCAGAGAEPGLVRRVETSLPGVNSGSDVAKLVEFDVEIPRCDGPVANAKMV
jgi:hypothetical protein